MLDAVASTYVNALAKGKQKTINPAWKSDLSNTYANYFGARRVYGSDGPGRSQWLHFCLGADVSEKGFSRQGIATVPDTKKANDKTGSDAARWTGTNELD